MKEGDIVAYNFKPYHITRVWNSFFSAYWVDLKSVYPIIRGTDVYRTELSVPISEVVLIKSL